MRRPARPPPARPQPPQWTLDIGHWTLDMSPALLFTAACLRHGAQHMAVTLPRWPAPAVTHRLRRRTSAVRPARALQLLVAPRLHSVTASWPALRREHEQSLLDSSPRGCCRGCRACLVALSSSNPAPVSVHRGRPVDQVGERGGDGLSRVVLHQQEQLCALESSRAPRVSPKLCAGDCPRPSQTRPLSVAAVSHRARAAVIIRCESMHVLGAGWYG